jgi:hypothetical protein
MNKQNYQMFTDLLRIYKLKKLSLDLTLDTSFAGEMNYLTSLMEKLSISSGHIIDIAASNGVDMSSTLYFFQKEFSGLAIEMDSNKFSELAFVYKAFPNVKLCNLRITPKNIYPVLKSFNMAQEISILNLDIDSYDLDVITSLLESGVSPRIISLEINEKIPPGIFFKVNYDDKHYWKGDHFYGCSLEAACIEIKKFNYVLVGLEFNNAFFVSKEIALGGLSDLSCGAAYREGYQYRKERKLLFPYNNDVDKWLEVTPENSLKMIAEYFKEYDGHFELKLI